MLKKILIYIIVLSFFNTFTNSIASTEVIVEDGKVPEGKKRIIKYVCDPNKSEYYWGENKNNMKLSRYEDSPYAKNQQSKGANTSYETLWDVSEIDFEAGYIYISGSMKYDANSDGKLDTMPYAQRSKIKSHDQSKGIYISETDRLYSKAKIFGLWISF